MNTGFDKSEHIFESLITEGTPRDLEIKEVVINVEKAFDKLHIDNWEIVKGVSISYKDSIEDRPLLGRVLCYSDDDIRIEYDTRFTNLVVEKDMLAKYCPQYPGLKKTLIHELAHIAMWSLTGDLRQPATRLLDVD